MKLPVLRLIVFVSIIAIIAPATLFAGGHLREDQTCGGAVDPTFFELFPDEDLTAHYSAGRYVTFSHNSHATSYRIGSSSFNFASSPFCEGLQATRVEPASGVQFPSLSGPTTNVRLWQNDPIDTTPPTISNIQATNITQTGATITWTTNENADSKVDYGTTTNYGSTKSSSSLTTSHSLAL